jgi:hypothetical protein
VTIDVLVNDLYEKKRVIKRYQEKQGCTGAAFNPGVTRNQGDFQLKDPGKATCYWTEIKTEARKHQLDPSLDPLGQTSVSNNKAISWVSAHRFLDFWCCRVSDA